MRKLIYPLLLAGIAAAGLLIQFGRGLWYPAYVKIAGGNSVAEVIEGIKEGAEFRYDFNQWKSLVLLCFKEEKKIEAWVTKKDGGPEKVREFAFTGYSGQLGPKLREGDYQIPEGVYQVEYLNPNSSYHLSIKINYPNEFDSEKGLADGRQKLGNDIFIHGKSATIGCIPIGDKNIEELFLMVAEIGKSDVQVIISPYDMREHKREIEIPEIDWEHELYSQIAESLNKYKPNKTELSITLAPSSLTPR